MSESTLRSLLAMLLLTGCSHATQTSRSGPAVAPAAASGPRLERLRGEFRYLADAAVFTDCASADRWPVSMEGDYLELERRYLDASPEAGAPVLVSLEARVEPRPSMEGDGPVPTLVVVSLRRVWTDGESCADVVATSLTNTRWRLIVVDERLVDSTGMHPEPHLRLTDAGEMSGHTGCNAIHATFEVGGRELQTGPIASTRRFCPEEEVPELALLRALEAVRRYRIDADVLELLDEQGSVLARFEAVLLE